MSTWLTLWYGMLFFVNSALKIQCHIVKNILLQAAFSAILPTGLGPFLTQKQTLMNEKFDKLNNFLWMFRFHSDLSLYTLFSTEQPIGILQIICLAATR